MKKYAAILFGGLTFSVFCSYFVARSYVARDGSDWNSRATREWAHVVIWEVGTPVGMSVVIFAVIVVAIADSLKSPKQDAAATARTLKLLLDSSKISPADHAAISIHLGESSYAK